LTTAVIVQARMGSSRLPGKVMQELAGRTVLHHVLERCRAIPGADLVVCAMPDEVQSAPLEAVARECGATTFRGSEKDVLARYLGAARSVSADMLMRVTSDCPLIDPGVCGEVLALRAHEGADYAANNTPRTYPHGLDCEAFTTAALAEADASTSEAYDHEHVTPWLRRAPHLKRANLSSGNPAIASHRWTLDYPEDLEFFRAVFAALPNGSPARMNEVLAMLAGRPDIVAINASRSLERAAS
jgi:glutamate-1-semialdehyde 2,1-aminomutase/spore coat polysaccharide biosynthesis protein SpsF